MCRAGQPVILVGDLNADPSVIPSLAEGLSDGAWIDVEKAFATGKGVAPALTCVSSSWVRKKAHARTSLLLALLQRRPPLHVAFCQIAGFPSHFAFRTDFSLSAWDATVEMARVYSPLWPACWVDGPDRSRRSVCCGSEHLGRLHPRAQLCSQER